MRAHQRLRAGESRSALGRVDRPSGDGEVAQLGEIGRRGPHRRDRVFGHRDAGEQRQGAGEHVAARTNGEVSRDHARQ
ncbi:hypothetical protein ACMGDM_10335 [Sphingomonas sp. DT-51]|uniref:hypothetical protein n=1 Tax=Sphingomonas sp. DT-51 TaxID=3396165 RepID=UPI003F1CD9C0